MPLKEIEIDSLKRASVGNDWSVILKVKGEVHYLPVYINSEQAYVLKDALKRSSGPDIGDKIFEGIDTRKASLISVIVDNPQNGVFHSCIFVWEQDVTSQKDCPVGATLALALKKGARILVDEHIFESEGFTIPYKLRRRSARGME